MTNRVTTIDRRDERRRSGRRPPRAHQRQPKRPDGTERQQVRGASVDRLVRAAEADLLLRWREARRSRRQEGAQALAGFLLEANETVVRRGAARFRPHRLAKADLEQAARLGLLRAMEGFDPEVGTPFGIYASYWVRKEVQRAVAHGEFPVALPVHLGGRALAVAGLLRAEPGTDGPDLGRRFGVGESVAAGLARLVRVAELPADAAADGQPGTEEWVIRDVLDRLAGDLRAVVVARFGFDGAGARSGRQVARELGISEFTVRSRLRRALRELERYLVD